MRVFTFVPANTQLSANGNTASFYIPEAFSLGTVYVEVTAVSGATPSMTVYLDEAWDAGNPQFVQAGASAAITATGVYKFDITGTTGTVLRIRYTVSGTFTVRIGGVFK